MSDHSDMRIQGQLIKNMRKASLKEFIDQLIEAEARYTEDDIDFDMLGFFLSEASRFGPLGYFKVALRNADLGIDAIVTGIIRNDLRWYKPQLMTFFGFIINVSEMRPTTRNALHHWIEDVFNEEDRNKIYQDLPDLRN